MWACFYNFEAMKKAAAILFALFYLFSAMGLAINIHYCGEQMHDIAIIDKAESCCDESNCCTGCEDKTIVIQNVKSEVVAPAIDFDFNGLYRLYALISTFVPADDDNPNFEYQWIDASPPPGTDIPILFCSLTFYG